MRIATICGAAVVPHAPILLPDIAGPKLHDSIAAVRGAVRKIEPVGDVVVIASPHGAHTGVYVSNGGSLSGFGLDGRDVEFKTDPHLAQDVAASWGVPTLEEPVDHGVLVPLFLSRLRDLPLVACTFGQTGPEARAAGEGLARALNEVEAASVFFVASAHTAAALSPVAPLQDRAEGHELDKRIRDAIGDDPSKVTAILNDLWERGGSCGLGPLTALALLSDGLRGRVLHHSAPAGVGYLVAALEK